MSAYGIQIIGSNGFVNSSLSDTRIVEEVNWYSGDVNKTYYPPAGETYHLLEIIQEKDMFSGGSLGKIGIMYYTFENNRLYVKTIFDWAGSRISTLYIVAKKVLV